MLLKVPKRENEGQRIISESEEIYNECKNYEWWINLDKICIPEFKI